MRLESLKQLLERVRSGEATIEEALEVLKVLPFEDLRFAKIDHHRLLRRGFPEAILCRGKSPDQVAAIALRIYEKAVTVLGTKAERDHYEAVRARIPDARYEATARMIVLQGSEPPSPPEGQKPIVTVISGGTADIPIAEECALTAELSGCRVDRIYDVGVAGLHRLLDHRSQWQQATVLVVVAGMEGALPSVVAGLSHQPVIAVPTSVGYGANFSGLAPLLTMLNSCAPGLAVVNIDNGYGAGYLAALIARLTVTRTH